MMLNFESMVLYYFLESKMIFWVITTSIKNRESSRKFLLIDNLYKTFCVDVATFHQRIVVTDTCSI